MKKEEVMKLIEETSLSDEEKVSLYEKLDEYADEPENISVEDGFKEKYEELLTRYKQRFLNPAEIKEDAVSDEEDETKKIIDVKEI